MWLIPRKEDSTPEQRWAWFLAHYTSRMERVLFTEAMRILGSQQDAEDVMQEAMIRGATRCWQLRDEEKLFQWMYTIVRNLAFDRHNNKRQALMCSIQLATGLIYKTIPLVDRIINMQDTAILQDAIQRLPHPEKDIIEIKFTTNMKLIDIARKLGLNYHTTRTKYRRTLEKLSRLVR